MKNTAIIIIAVFLYRNLLHFLLLFFNFIFADWRQFAVSEKHLQTKISTHGGVWEISRFIGRITMTVFVQFFSSATFG